MKAFLCVLLALVSLSMVSAVTYQVALTNCGVTSSSYFCGDSIVASCNVNDTLSAQGVNSVVFNIGGTQYQAASPVAGNAFVGTWQVSVPVTQNTVSGTLSSVTAYVSNGNVCSASDNQNSVSGCWVNFSAQRDYSVNCSCTFAESTICGPDNVATVQHVPGAGCTASAYTTYGACSYCDPQWTPVYSACAIPSNATLATRLIGVSTKTYVALNQACLDATLVDSLKTPPVDDNTQVTCVEDFWLGAGRQDEQDNNDYGIKQMANAITYNSVQVSASSETGGVSKFKPVVFDFNNDGISEIAVFTSNGFNMYSPAGSLIQSAVVSYDIWGGQPSFMGMSAWNHAVGLNGTYTDTYWDQDLFNGANGGAIAGIRKDLGNNHNHFVVYRLTNGSFTKITDVNLFSNGITTYGGQGVLCHGSLCYFGDDQGDMVRIDALNGTVILSGGLNGTNTNVIDSVPVALFVEPTQVQYRGGMGSPNVVAVQMFTSAGAVTIKACYMDFSSCNVVATGLTSTGRLAATSEGNAVLYLVGLNSSVWKYAMFQVTNNLAMPEVLDTLPMNAGDNVSCVSDPAPGRCYTNDPAGVTGQGVYLAVHKTTSSGGGSYGTGVFPPSDFHYDRNITMASPWAQTYGAANSQFGGLSCSNNNCYTWSGNDVSSYFDGASMQRAVGLNGWGSAATIPVNVSHKYMRSCSLGIPIYTSDALLAVGSSQGDAYAVIGSIPSNPTTCSVPPNAGYPQYGIYGAVQVWKFSHIVAQWSLIGNASDVSVATSQGGVVPKKMFCDNRGCGYETPQNSVDGATKIGIIYVNSATGVVSTIYQDKLGNSLGDGDQIYGFVQTASANYYSYHDTGRSYVIRQKLSDLSNPSIVAASPDDNEEVVGLHARQGSDEVAFAEVPSSNSGLCFYNGSTNSSSPQANYFTSGMENWGRQENSSISIYYQARTATCTQTLVVASGGVTIRSKSYPVKKWLYDQSIYYPTIDGSWSDGGIDANGKHYVLYADALPAGGSYSAFYYTLEVMDENGVYHPSLVVQSQGNITVLNGNNGVPLLMCTMQTYSKGSSSCLPIQYDGTQYSLVSHGGIPTEGSGGFFPDVQISGLQYIREVSAVMGSGQVTPIEQTGEVTEFGCYGQNGVKYNYYQIPATSCMHQIALTDVNGDGFPDVVAPTGIYKSGFANTKLFDFTGNLTDLTDTSSVIAVDVNSDTFGDVLVLTGTQLDYIVSVPKVSAVYAPVLTFKSASCTFNPATKQITAVAIGVGAPDSTNLGYSAMMKNSAGATSGVTNGWTTNGVLLPVYVPDNYTVTLTVGENYPPYDTISKDCSVNAFFVANSTLGRNPLTSCSLDPAGEFNFNDLLVNHMWFNDGDTTTDPVSDGNYLLLNPGDSGIFHSIACPDNGLNVSTRVYVDATSDIKIVAQGQQNGANLDMGGFEINGLNLLTASNVLLSQDLTAGWHDVEVDFDQTTALYSVILDGVSKGGTTFANNMNGEFSFVYVFNVGGSSKVDYVRTSGLTGVLRDIRNDTQKRSDLANLKLNDCTAASDRNFSAQPAGSLNRTFYPDVNLYCQTLHAGETGGKAYCTMSDLKNVISYNGNCYKESYNYCVDVIYGRNGLMGGALSDSMASQNGLDGAAACLTSLSMSTAANRVIAPLGYTIWVVIRDNALVLFLIGILVVIGLAAKRRQ